LIALIQRVTGANVKIAGDPVGVIGKGVLALIGVERGDSEFEALLLAEKVVNYRIFPNAEGRMNVSLKDANAQLLAVPQFTLAADTKSGTRASFSSARVTAMRAASGLGFSRSIATSWKLQPSSRRAMTASRSMSPSDARAASYRLKTSAPSAASRGDCSAVVAPSGIG
jgi:D-tyrosyl-tRNA(Tyr) deacylase